MVSLISFLHHQKLQIVTRARQSFTLTHQAVLNLNFFYEIAPMNMTLHQFFLVTSTSNLLWGNQEKKSLPLLTYSLFKDKTEQWKWHWLLPLNKYIHVDFYISIYKHFGHLESMLQPFHSLLYCNSKHPFSCTSLNLSLYITKWVVIYMFIPP